VLHVEGLRVDYGPIKAVRSVDLRVEQGEIVALLGANGAGKSSLLNAVAGLAPVSAGRIELDGRNIAGRPAEQVVRAGVALVPEGRRVFPRLSVRDNLRLGGASQRDPELRTRTLAELLDRFPVLRERLAQQAGTLSGGEQQMLAVARALMSAPRLLLLDEPSLGLAPIVVQEIFRLVESLRAGGTTILLVEQNVHLALGIADRGYVMVTGQIDAEGQAHELRESGGIEEAYLGVGAGA